MATIDDETAGDMCPGCSTTRHAKMAERSLDITSMPDGKGEEALKTVCAITGLVHHLH